MTDLIKAADALAEAMDRQGDNMAFVINNVSLPEQWRDKFMVELEKDRSQLTAYRQARESAGERVKVKPLVWHEEPQLEVDEFGCKMFGEFSADSIVATCKTIYCAIYRHSSSKYMWVDGTLDNIRYSTYRKPPNWDRVEIPWLDSEEAAKAAAQADYEARIKAALEI